MSILLFQYVINLLCVKLTFYALHSIHRLSILYLIILLKLHEIFIPKVLMTLFKV